VLVSLQSHLLSFIKDGVSASSAYNHALEFIRGKGPSLETKFVKNLGFGVNLFIYCSSGLEANPGYRRV
jgi:nucleosome binding factor SPN SPT16 subunit